MTSSGEICGRCLCVGKPVHDTVGACLHRALAEVQQEANTEIGQPQVSSHLAMMNRNQPLKCFHFDDDALADYEVGIVGTRDLRSL